MHRTAPALLLALALSPSAFAQSANPYDGTWKVVYDGQKVAGQEGTAVVSDKGGTWKVLGSKKDRCTGREVPITVSSATADELAFSINRSKVLEGCKDQRIKLKKVDDKTLTGSLGDDRSVTLTRP